jgi:hypothetical protein
VSESLIARTSFHCLGLLSLTFPSIKPKYETRRGKTQDRWIRENSTSIHHQLVLRQRMDTLRVKKPTEGLEVSSEDNSRLVVGFFCAFLALSGIGFCLVSE